MPSLLKTGLEKETLFQLPVIQAGMRKKMVVAEPGTAQAHREAVLPSTLEAGVRHMGGKEET